VLVVSVLVVTVLQADENDLKSVLEQPFGVAVGAAELQMVLKLHGAE
jgi:hypothetical protein